MLGGTRAERGDVELADLTFVGKGVEIAILLVRCGVRVF